MKTPGSRRASILRTQEKQKLFHRRDGAFSSKHPCSHSGQQAKAFLPVIHGDDGDKAGMLPAWARLRRLPAGPKVTQGHRRRAP
jgi:hypothetical protein